MGVGGSLDVMSWSREAGAEMDPTSNEIMEWLYRTAKEPLRDGPALYEDERPLPFL